MVIAFRFIFAIAAIFGVSRSMMPGNGQVSSSQPLTRAGMPDLTVKDDDTERILGNMTLREKIAQMIISNSEGFSLDDNSAEFKRLKGLVENEKVGGFIFFKGNSLQEADLINKLQALSGIPLLMSADFERGTRMRLEDGSLFPNNMALGATRDPELSYKMGKAIAEECRAIGIHQNYSPVVDVNNNALNPIINVRSFGEDPELVSLMGDNMIRGLQDGNVIATAKHFPGHGDTEIDSHNDLPVLNFGMARLEQTELPPFVSAIKSGVMSVMIAHLSFPNVDDEPFVPASLSEKLIRGVLLEKLGFKGLVVTDALNMAGVVKHFSTEDVAVRCAKAGVDLILMPQGEARTINAIEDAVATGIISEERINESARKILNAKKWLNISGNKFSDPERVRIAVNSEKSKELASIIAAKSITLVKNSGNIIPSDGSRHKKCLIVSLNNGNEKANSDLFLSEFKARSSFEEISWFDLSGDVKNVEAISSDAEGYDIIIIPVYAKVKIMTGTVGLPESQLALINSITAKGKDVCVVSFGNPYLINGFPDVNSYVCAYSDSEASVSAGIDAILGKAQFAGKLPVTLSNEYRFGHGLSN